MAFELDHVFICTEINAPEADRLLLFGLTEGTARIHPGQGTANRRFFFHNFMLELLWIQSSEEAQSKLSRPTRLWERWHDRNRGSCPFGICLRSANQSVEELPFSNWAYRPAYLPESLSISVGTNADIVTEPMLFYLSFAKRQGQYSNDQRQPLDHAIGFREVTRVALVSPHAARPSIELQTIIDRNMLELKQGENYCIELGFDDELQGKHANFQPELPLILHW